MTKLSYRVRLLLFFALWWLAWAYKPWHPDDWVLENILTVAFVALLFFTRKVFPLSNVSYTVLFAFLCFHTVGAHYTYADVPYEQWFAAVGLSIRDIFGLSATTLIAWCTICSDFSSPTPCASCSCVSPARAVSGVTICPWSW